MLEWNRNLKKSREHLLRDLSEVFQFMKDYQKEYPIGKMCKVFRVIRSGYYQSRNYLPTRRDGENGLLLSEIRKIHQQSKAIYGSRRMTKELKARGFEASRPRVAR